LSVIGNTTLFGLILSNSIEGEAQTGSSRQHACAADVIRK